MNDAELRRLVEEIVRAVLAKHFASLPNPAPQAAPEAPVREPLLPLTIRGDERPPSRTFIVSDDIYRAQREGVGKLEFPSTAVVTDQARDLARSLQIELVIAG